jgi:hypothetical protein
MCRPVKLPEELKNLMTTAPMIPDKNEKSTKLLLKKNTNE